MTLRIWSPVPQRLVPSKSAARGWSSMRTSVITRPQDTDGTDSLELVAGFPGPQEPPSHGQALSLLLASELWRGLPTLPQADLNSLAHLRPGLPTTGVPWSQLGRGGQPMSVHLTIRAKSSEGWAAARLQETKKTRAKKERSQVS